MAGFPKVVDAESRRRMSKAGILLGSVINFAKFVQTVDARAIPASMK